MKPAVAAGVAPPRLSSPAAITILEPPGRERGAWGLGPLLLLALFAGVTFKQIIINIYGGDRHPVSLTIEILAAFYIGATTWIMLGMFLRYALRRTSIKFLAATHAMALLWWTGVLVLGPNNDGDWSNRLSGFATDIGLSLLIWTPVAFLRRREQLRTVTIGASLLLVYAALVGIVQFLVPPTSMPALMRPDATVYITQTGAGTTRVNGLIGNPIEFALTMTLGAIFLYVATLDRPSVSRIVALGAVLTAVFVAASRAAWIATAALIVLVTHPRRVAILAIPAAFFGLATVVLLPSGYWTAYFDNPRPYLFSDSARVAAITEAVARIAESPWFGSGMGLQTGFASESKIITDGYWWALMLEGGIPGFATAMILFITLGVVLRVSLKGGDRTVRVWSAAGLAALALLGGTGIIDSWLTNQSAAVAYYLTLGLCFAAGQIPEIPPTIHGRQLSSMDITKVDLEVSRRWQRGYPRA